MITTIQQSDDDILAETQLGVSTYAPMGPQANLEGNCGQHSAEYQGNPCCCTFGTLFCSSLGVIYLPWELVCSDRSGCISPKTAQNCPSTSH